MSSKVIRIGNSTGISVPKADLAKLGLKVGDAVTLKAVRGKAGGQIRIQPASQPSTELAAWTDKFIERYRPALEALAKK